MPDCSPGLRPKVSGALLKTNLEPTVIHRVKYKSRPSFRPSSEKNNFDVSPNESLSNSGNDVSSGKSSNPRPADSTEGTSLASNSSMKSNPDQQNLSENRGILQKQHIGPDGDQLACIMEDDRDENQLHEPIPSMLFGILK